MNAAIRKTSLTVEQRRCVDALTLNHPGEVPHLVKRDALYQTADHTYHTEGSEEVDCRFAQMLESFDNS